MFLLVALYFILALSFSMSKGVLLHADPVFFTGVRMVLAGILLLGYHCIIKRGHIRIAPEHRWFFAQLVLFHVFIPYVFEFWALETVSAATDALFFNLTPFITALLSLILCSERLSLKQWMGLGIGFVGFLPMLYAQQPLNAFSWSLISLSKAELLLIMAVSASSYAWIIMQNLVRGDQYQPVLVNGISMFWGGLVALIVSGFTETTFIKTTTAAAFWTYDIPMFVWYLAVLILLTNFISYNLYGFLLKKYSATFIALAGSMTPIFTALFDWILFGELITWHFIVTVILVFIGLFIFYSDELKTMRRQRQRS
jgi:drug/metabolite transporter (DMT)-like permease